MVTTTGGLTVGAAVTGDVGAAVCVSLETVVLSLADSVCDVEDVVVSELVVVDVDVLVVVVVRDESSSELSLLESDSDDESSCCDESPSATECFCR